MGSDHLRNNRLSHRCCQGVCFGTGFLIGLLFVSGMFWILWCYLGLSIVQVSHSQRRALVNYSYTSAAPPTNRTDAPKIESSNAISRSASTSTTASRTPGRGESHTAGVRKDSDPFNATAKGDFAARNRFNVAGQTPERSSAAHAKGVTTASPLPEDDVKKASILIGEDDDVVHARRVPTSVKENRPPENPRVDIVPTQVYDYDAENRPREDKPLPRDRPDKDLPRRDDIQSSRRSNPDYRDPDFERDYLPRPPSRRRYDDDEDPRGSRGRYDRRDRGRDTDDRLSKGDTRVYPDEIDERRSRTRLDDDRYSSRDRYDDRRSDEGYRDRDDSKYRSDDRYPEDRYRTRNDEVRRDRTNDRRIVDQDDDYRYRPRDERDRFRDDEYRYRGDEGRLRDDDDDYRIGRRPSEDRKSPRQNSSVLDEGRRYSESSVRDRDRDRYDDDRYDEGRSRRRDYRDEDQPDRLLRRNSSTTEDRREYRDSLERDRPRVRPADRDDDYRRYDERDRIVPSRVREEYSSSRSSPLVTRDEPYDSRSTVDRSRDRESSRSYDRDTRYYDDRRTDIVGSRRTDPEDREYRTRTSDDRRVDDREYRTRTSDERRPVDRYPDRRDDIVLDRRSYGSDDDPRPYEPRIRPGDEEYVRRPARPDDDEYRRDRPRGDYDRPRYRDDYDGDRLPSRTYPDRYRPDDLDDSPPRSSQRDDDRRRVGSARYPEDDRPPKTTRRDVLTGSAMSPVPSRVGDGVLDREKRYRPQEDKPERPLSAQEVIEAAHRHANRPDSDSRKVFYPVFDPRVSNLTTPEIIRPSERRGTTLGSRRKRTATF